MARGMMEIYQLVLICGHCSEHCFWKDECPVEFAFDIGHWCIECLGIFSDDQMNAWLVEMHGIEHDLGRRVLIRKLIYRANCKLIAPVLCTAPVKCSLECISHASRH